MPMRGLASLPILSVIAGAVAVAMLSRPPVKSISGGDEKPLLPRPEVIHWLGSAEQQMVADYYWVLMTEAIGRAMTRSDYRNIYDYADLITELDPSMRLVYVFGGASVPFNSGRETWSNTNESTELLRKGLARFPKDVYLRILLAYNLSYFHHQYREAADLLRETVLLPGAPKYLQSLATRLYAQAGAIDSGLDMARELSQSAADPETRAMFEHRAKELKLERDLQRIDRAIAAYRKREGRPPGSVAELVDAGDIASIPIDPLEGVIVIGSDGRSHSTAELEQRLEVYDPKRKLDQG